LDWMGDDEQLCSTSESSLIRTTSRVVIEQPRFADNLMPSERVGSYARKDKMLYAGFGDFKFQIGDSPLAPPYL